MFCKRFNALYNLLNTKNHFNTKYHKTNRL